MMMVSLSIFIIIIIVSHQIRSDLVNTYAVHRIEQLMMAWHSLVIFLSHQKLQQKQKQQNDTIYHNKITTQQSIRLDFRFVDKKNHNKTIRSGSIRFDDNDSALLVIAR
jgi:hypothetical protein